jgi:basic membrane protein A
MKKSFYWIAVLLMIAMVFSACTPAAPAAEEPAVEEQVAEEPAVEEPAAEQPAEKVYKVALVLPGVITDGSWCAAAYSGLEAAIAQYDNIETTYSESVQLADFENVYRDYASKGYDLIIGHGSEYADVSMLMAKEYPNTYFAVTNADVSADNVAGLDTKNEEAGYVAGFIAGLLSKSKKVGYVGGMEILAMKRGEVGFRAGVPDSCPDCEVVVSYVGSNDDVAKGKETAYAMIDKGVDVIYQSANAAGLGVIEAGKEKNILLIGNTADQAPLAPDNVVTSTVRNLSPVITQIIGDMASGNFKGGVRMHGFDTGIYYLSDFNKNLITDDQIATVEAQVQKLINGEVKLEHISSQ